MKIRKGLVSNSSSSSFAVIGICRWNIGQKKMDEICEALKLNYENEEHGEIHSDLLVVPLQAWGSYEDSVYYFGIDASWAFVSTRMDFEYAVDFFIEMMKDNYGITIQRDDVGFHYGEAGSG